MITGSAEQPTDGNVDFESIVRAHQDRVLSTCYRFTGNREDAEDVAQEVFMEVHRSLDDFRGDARLSTWIYRVAVNKSLDFLRRKKRKKRYGFLVSIGTSNEDAPEVQVPDNATPEAEVESQERSRILQRAVGKLPDSQRVAVTLGKYEGRSYKEIAEIMGTTIPAVESLIHRGMRNLRKRLTGYYEKML